MSDSVETIARAALTEVLPEAPAEAIAADDRFDRLGLTSLNKVLFLTSVCERTGVGLHHFTEEEVAGLQTLGQVVVALNRYSEVV